MNHGKEMKKGLSVGIISDTHNLLRPEAEEVLNGSDLIIHAGDIGDPSILQQLENIAPVVAVRGNTDGGWAYTLQRTEVIEKSNILIYVIHDLSMMDINPASANIRVVVSGHTHRPSVSRHKGVLYVNPGSAGPRRMSLPVSVAILHVNEKSVDAKIVKLDAKRL
jgi:putative phosphoesterase